MPNYFLYFFADFFFSSRTSFWTRFSIGCAHIVRSIMPFAGRATRFLTFGFLTLDFLGAIFFWYFSLRKIFRRKQKFCSIQMCSICYSCCWRPRRLNRKTWRPSRGSLHRVLVWVCAYSYFRWRPWRPFYFLNIIDKRKNKKEHFCSSGSSGRHEDTQHQT